MFDEYGFPREPEIDEFAPILCTYVYCSRAAEGVDDAEVDRIVESAQQRNLVCGITGVLVCGGGVFFQCIEGPAAQVKHLIASLHRDQRHQDVVSLEQSEEERERLYPNWAMEQVEANDIRSVLKDAIGSAGDENRVAALKRILKHLDSGPLDSLGRS